MRPPLTAGCVPGELIEIPVPLYAKGVELALVDYSVSQRFLVLPRGRPDERGAYIRCLKMTWEHGARVVDPARSRHFPEPPGMIVPMLDRKGKEHPDIPCIPNAWISRILPLMRTQVSRAELTDPVAVAFRDYLFASNMWIITYSDPTLTWSTWMLTKTPEYQEKLEKMRQTGVFDRCLELLHYHYLPLLVE